MKFNEWLKQREKLQKEVSTSTGDVAQFARPIMGAQRRQFPDKIVDEKKKK